MSHVFEALRKSEGHKEDFLLTGEGFFDAVESTVAMGPFPAAQASMTQDPGLAVWAHPESLAADRYRRLRIGLAKLQIAGKLRTLLVSSPAPQDGKSTATLNLATVLAAKGKHQTLVIEADLRRPSLARRLGLESKPGLSACLAEGLDPVEAVRRIDPMGFHLLAAGEAAGEAAASPTEMLQSERMTALVQNMSGRFDWILIDSPPAGPIADALALKPRADAGLLVARAGKTQREAVEECVRQLGAGFIAAVILNGMEGLDGEHSDYYEKYYRQP